MPRSQACLHMLIAVAICVATADTTRAQCQPRVGYYASIDTRSVAALRRTLHARIENHRRVPWSGTWAVLEAADQDPANARNVLDVYKNASYRKVGRGNPNYNREHTWPKSLGFASSSSNNYPEADCHALFLSDVSYNSARANKVFRNVERTAQEYGTLRGGVGKYPGNSCWTSGFGVTGAWEAWHGRRGDVARALFYLDVRYDGSSHSRGASEPDLILTDDMARIAASQSKRNLSVAYMGLLSVLLQWHQQDPPDAKECARNAAIERAQGNRNPFIDHPEWATLLFERAGRDVRRPWINEFHYDNAGADVGEMVEIAAPAGFDLTGWRVVAYNGSGGGAYDSIFLSGSVPSAGCIGVRAFDFKNLQNGPRDGLALVDPRNRVVEFLSYEGVLKAVDGPAVDMTSRDVGVFENSSTPVGSSLQRSGRGMLSSDFLWSTPAPNTRGRVNSNQAFVGGCGRVIVYGCGPNPFGSIDLASGAASIGRRVGLALHNPLGTQAAGSAALLWLSPKSTSGFPCGIPLPLFGMRSPNIPGELLIQPTGVVILSAPVWNGTPSVITLPVPNDPRLVNSTFFTQGAIVDPRAAKGVLIGLTDAMRVTIGR